MSEFNIEVEGGSSVRLRTAGKYCDRDIVVTASGGGSEGGSDLAKLIDRSITEISDDSVTIIGNHAFYACSFLETVDFPNATSISEFAFYNCVKLTTASFPVATSISINAFYGCYALTTADFPVATSIGSSAFYNCKALTTADFPVATSISSSAFRFCATLTTVILRNTAKVAPLSSINAFSDTPIASGTGYIYVPAALVDSYKAASNWSNYANQIRAIEDYPDICGG